MLQDSLALSGWRGSTTSASFRFSSLLWPLACRGGGMAQTQFYTIPVSGGGTLTLSYSQQSTCDGGFAEQWNGQTYTAADGTSTGANFGIVYLSSAGCGITGGWDSSGSGSMNGNSNSVSVPIGNCTLTFSASIDDPYGQAYISCATPTVISGYINPKYVVLSVLYSPPGSDSYVEYGNSVTNGTSTSIEKSFNGSNSFSVSLTASTGIFGLLSGSVTNTQSTTNTQVQDSSSSIAILKSTSKDTYVFGPPHDGLDHSYDQVAIWLNPVVNLSFSSGNLQQAGYDFDLSDTCYCMDVVYLTIRELLNPSLIDDPNTLLSLKRSWSPNLADGSSPGLTSADLLAIAASDPYSNPSYIPTMEPDPDNDGSVCSTDGRFCQADNSNVPYTQGIDQDFMQTSSTTDTRGQSATDKHQVSYSIDTTVKAAFLASLSASIKNTNTLTWTNEWTSETSSMVGQTSDAHIVGPADYSYSGPTEFCIYTDNVYGTYMFLPCN